MLPGRIGEFSKPNAHGRRADHASPDRNDVAASETRAAFALVPSGDTAEFNLA